MSTASFVLFVSLMTFLLTTYFHWISKVVK